MVSTMKERFEELKKYRNVSLNYDEILLFYPDYFKTKIELGKEIFISKEYVDKEFEDNYKNSPLYNTLVESNMAEKEIYEFMNCNKNSRYLCFEKLFNKLVNSSIELCELIDYIGHYPTTYPVPTETEKNPKMEELLERYDIIVRYYFGDIDEMQIMSDDVVRIVERLEEYLKILNSIKEKCSSNDWLFARKMSEKERTEIVDYFIKWIDEFPLSNYQKQEKSRREEGKRYLRLQHGNNVI